MNDIQEYKKDLSPSSSSQDSQSDADSIVGNDPPQRRLQCTIPSPNPPLTKAPSSHIVMIYTSNQNTQAFVDNQKHSESQKISNNSSSNRPRIYDQASRQKDYKGYWRQRNYRQPKNERQYNYRNGDNYPNQQRREYDNLRYDQQGQEETRRNYDINRRNDNNINRPHGYHQDNRYRHDPYYDGQNHRYQNNSNFQWNQNQRNQINRREQFNFERQSPKFNLQNNRNNNYQQHDYRNQRLNRYYQDNYNQQSNYQIQTKPFNRNNPQNQNHHYNQSRRQGNRNNLDLEPRNSKNSHSRSKNEFKPVKNNNNNRKQSSRSNSKFNQSKRTLSNQSRFRNAYQNQKQKRNQRTNQPQRRPQNHAHKQANFQKYDKHQQPQKFKQEEEPFLQNKKSSNQHKEEQPPNILSHKESSKSVQSNQNKTSSLNQAHSHITVEISTLPQNNKNLDESSDWQPSDKEEQSDKEEDLDDQKSEDQSKSIEKSSFQCHQISIEYPSIPPVVNRNDHNISSFVEDLSLLQALDPLNSLKDQNNPKNLNINQEILKPIQKKQEQKHVNPIQKAQKQEQSRSIFTLKEFKILQKMFDSIPLQDQTIFVQIRVKTSNVSQYKIKQLSSELYQLEGTTPQQLKGHKYIMIKDCQKAVPRDQQPHGGNRQSNEKIELKASKIVLAQIKNPVNLLNHKEDLLAKFQSLEERQVINRIEKNQKLISKASTMINIEQVTLKCSSCNSKKSFFWSDQIISHQCKVQCANLLRFSIDSISIC